MVFDPFGVCQSPIAQRPTPNAYISYLCIPMIITIDKAAGFCPGVRKAIRTAEKQLEKGKDFLSLGSLLHNEEEMGRLKDRGLRIVRRSDFPDLSGKKILFRAHGEPPETYELADKYDVEVVDTTCGVVRRLNRQVAAAAKEMKGKNGQVVIFGKKDHPEIIGLLGNSNGLGILVTSLQDLGKVDMKRPVRLFSQTTMDESSFDLIAHAVREQMEKHNARPELVVHKSICRHVLKRVPAIKAFASEHELIIFVSGKNSSNGKKLFNICSGINPNTHFVSEPGELKAEWFEGIGSVGISGAASTPQWLMEKVAGKIKEFV